MEKSDRPAGQSKNIDPSQMGTPDSGTKPTGPPAMNIGHSKSKNVYPSQSTGPPAMNIGQRSKNVYPSQPTGPPAMNIGDRSKNVDPSQTGTSDSGTNKNVDPSQTETSDSGAQIGYGRLSKNADLSLNTGIQRPTPEQRQLYNFKCHIGGSVYKSTTRLPHEFVAVKKLNIFAEGGLLWVVSPYLEHSLPKLLSASGWAPLNEELIAPILKGTLTGLAFLLQCDEIPYWYPPEFLTTKINWAFDIWAVGILALELGLGRPLYSMG